MSVAYLINYLNINIINMFEGNLLDARVTVWFERLAIPSKIKLT